MIKSDTYAVTVCEAMGIDPRNVRRVLIDAVADEPLRVYVDFYGGAELLDVKLPAGEIEVKILDGRASEATNTQAKVRQQRYFGQEES